MHTSNFPLDAVVVGTGHLPDGPVRLGIRVTADEYVFVCEPDELKARVVGRLPVRQLSREEAGGFTGVFLGLYASVDTAAAQPTVWYEWCECEGSD